ncbi:3D domain-containing protein [Winogradskyella ludwigii]|uniref:3D domain-containing protein n=1 Tax=Winogradskyella ludwigii TaxID=2686076 RepID=UPI0015CB2F08|nr:3D domain-containing protein [Winogradskyella ludwigii]
MKPRITLIFVSILCLYNCNTAINNEQCNSNTIKVTATAYNSLAYQTSSNPSITAFGDSLKPGQRYIAVSRDLLDSGLVHNTQVKIQGFDSLYTVKDKMNRRWRKRIDIYMGTDVKKAKQWGKKKVEIEFCVKTKDSIPNENVSP